MKVYVDELPKNCFECPCFRDDIDFPCGLSDGTKDYFLDEIDGGECPLKSLGEHDNQVRKEVAKEIKSALRKNVVKMMGHRHCYPESAIYWTDVVTILGKIGEKENEN